MQIKDAKEMIKYRNYFYQKLADDYLELEELNEKLFSNRKRKKELEENIDKWNYGLDKIEDIMLECATFKSKEFAPFIARFLTLTEDNYELTSIKIKKMKNSPSGRWCYFVSDETIHSFLEENIFDESDYSYFIDNVLDENTFVFDNEQIYPFNSDFTMKAKFAKHPRLKTAIYELIDLKIKNKDLSDDERFQIVLNNTVRRNIEHGYQKKKINN